MAYSSKQKKRTVFTKGKFYHIDTLQETLPGTVIISMFRKPVVGEKTPDGILYDTERGTELSDYSMCIASFAITVSILFDNPEQV